MASSSSAARPSRAESSRADARSPQQRTGSPVWTNEKLCSSLELKELDLDLPLTALAKPKEEKYQNGGRNTRLATFCLVFAESTTAASRAAWPHARQAGKHIWTLYEGHTVTSDATDLAEIPHIPPKVSPLNFFIACWASGKTYPAARKKAEAQRACSMEVLETKGDVSKGTGIARSTCSAEAFQAFLVRHKSLPQRQSTLATCHY